MSDLDSNTEAFAFTIDDRFYEYQSPAVPFDWYDTTWTYHTFGIELLPNELRFLYDSNVVLRLPDRMIPQDNRYYDIMKNLDRTVMKFFVGEIDLNPNSDWSDPYGSDSTRDMYGNYISRTYAWRHDFETRYANHQAGFDTLHGQPTAHKHIDYVKVWDIPSGTQIPNYPR